MPVTCGLSPAKGAKAQRLTAGVGLESYPVFSPDGKSIAFAGEYEGNLDVYVIPAAGGMPCPRDPSSRSDVPVGWTNDGKQIIFRSPRHSYGRFLAALHVPATGGPATELPLPMAEAGSLSPDGKRIVYVPYSNKPQFPGPMRPLKHYRGGSASPIWIADLADSSITKVERKDSTDFDPMWIGDTIYFLSDREGPMAVYRATWRARASAACSIRRRREATSSRPRPVPTPSSSIARHGELVRSEDAEVEAGADPCER